MRLVSAVIPDKVRVQKVLQVDRCLLLLLTQLLGIPDFLNGHLSIYLSHTSTPLYKFSTPETPPQYGIACLLPPNVSERIFPV